MIEQLMKAMIPKEVFKHLDKIESGNIISDYIKVMRKESDLSRSKRDAIISKFNNYKKRGFYSEKQLENIDLKIAK